MNCAWRPRIEAVARVRTALSGAGGSLGAGGSMPVGNLSGVTFSTVNLAAAASNSGASATGGATTGTMLVGRNKNVSLDSGSQMTMSVSPR